METVKRIEEKLNEAFELLDKKDKELKKTRLITKALYEQLLQIKKTHEQKNNKRG